MGMTTEIGVIDNGQLLRVSGRLDGASSPALEKDLLGQFATQGARVLVDLSGLDYVSSAGLRVILMASKRARQVQGRLVLCALQAQVSEVFEMSGFSRILEIVASEADGRKRMAE